MCETPECGTAPSAHARLLSSVRAWGWAIQALHRVCRCAQHGTVIADHLPFWITSWQIPRLVYTAAQAQGITPLHRVRKGAAVNKPTIAILSLAAIVLNAIAFIGYGPAVATQLFGCRSSLYGSPATGCASSTSTAVAIGLVLYVGGVIVGLAAWFGGLIKTGQIRRWGWFVAVLLLPALGSLLYGLAGPTQRKL